MSSSSVSPLYAVLSHLVGTVITVTLKDDCCFTGLLSFETLLNPDARQIIIDLAKEEDSGQLHFDAVRLHFDRIKKITGVSRAAAGSNISTEFKTDSGITSKLSPTSKVLQPWQGENVQESSASFYSLGSTPKKSKWDQFRANQRLFGVTISFDESQYTTPINRDNPDYLKRMERADLIAREIETKRANGFNMAIDGARTAEQHGDEEDEEALYSQVKRELLPEPQQDLKSKPKTQLNINAAEYVPSAQPPKPPQSQRVTKPDYPQQQPYYGTVYFHPPTQYYYNTQQMSTIQL